MRDARRVLSCTVTVDDSHSMHRLGERVTMRCQRGIGLLVLSDLIERPQAGTDAPEGQPIKVYETSDNLLL